MSTATAQSLGPGLHRDIPAANYHALPHCSNSRLSCLAASCPAKVRYEMDCPPAATPALLLGSVVHCMVLEPNCVSQRIAVSPRCDKRTKEGKEIWLRWQAANPNKIILNDEQAVQAHAMAQAVKNSPHAAALLERASQREVSAIWQDKTGLTCKARFDALSEDPAAAFALDLKMTIDASPQGFERSLDNYGYARQAAFYLAGAAKLGLAIEDFVIVAVEKDPPYLVAVHRVSDAALEAATRELRPLIEAYWLAERTGDWKGYEPRDTDLPGWARKRIDNQKETAA